MSGWGWCKREKWKKKEKLGEDLKEILFYYNDSYCPKYGPCSVLSK